MAYEWGIWYDLETERGIRQYTETGLRLDTPYDIQAMEDEQRRRVAKALSELLDNVYAGNYPQSTKETDALADSMGTGETCMFTLSIDESVIAMASLVQRPNSMRGELSFAELSKAAKRQNSELTATVSVRHLSKYRIPWAFDNLPNVDFLYGSSRAAIEGRDGIPGGKQAQSIWWGGRRYGVYLPLLASNVGWNFKLGGVEPLSGFVIPTNVARWAKAVKELPVFVPNESVKQAIDVLFVEGTDGKVQPQTILTPETGSWEPFLFQEARPPSADIVTKYYATERAEHLAKRSAADMDEQLGDAISQKVIIESDLASTTRGVAVMSQLLEHGWALAGWQPSEVVYGGICPIFARVNPWQLHELIKPIHYPRYFDECGLGGTKYILDGMYQAMYKNAVHRRDKLNKYL